MDRLEEAIKELLAGRWNPNKQKAFDEIINKLFTISPEYRGLSAGWCARLAAEKLLPILSNPITAGYRVEGILLAKELLKYLPEHDRVLYKELDGWRRGLPVTDTIRDQAMSIIKWGLEKYGVSKFKEIIEKRIVYPSREYKICREFLENSKYFVKLGKTKRYTNYAFCPGGVTKVEKLIIDLDRFIKTEELRKLREERKRLGILTEEERRALEDLALWMKEHIRTEKEILEDMLKDLEAYVDLDIFRIWLYLDDIQSLRAKLGKPVPKDEKDFITMKLREGYKPPEEKIVAEAPPGIAKYIKTE